eukprot:scaffold185626_cov17-Tisochrysis_lutea.AAC.1
MLVTFMTTEQTEPCARERGPLDPQAPPKPGIACHPMSLSAAGQKHTCAPPYAPTQCLTMHPQR